MSAIPIGHLESFNLLSYPVVVTQSDLTTLFTNKSCSRITSISSLLSQIKKQNPEILELSKCNKEQQLTTMISNQFKITVSKIHLQKNKETMSALLFEISIDKTPQVILPESDHEYLLLSETGEVIQMNTTAQKNKVATSYLRTHDFFQNTKGSDNTSIDNVRFSMDVETEEMESVSIWYEISVSKMQSNPLLKPHYILQCSDITEMVTITEKLDRCTKRIQKTQDFISNLAHEIRTPLNGILGMLQYLKCSDLTTEQHSCLDTAINSSYALTHLLSDVLDLSKIEAGELTATIVPTSFQKVARLMEDLSQLYGNAVIRKGLSLYIDYPLQLVINTSTTDDSFRTESTPNRMPPLRRSSSENILLTKNSETISQFYTDIMRVRQIIVNLISNAVKYTHSGFIKIKLHLISACNAGTQLEKLFPIQIEVSDSGEGISNEDVRNVFSRFKRFHGAHGEEERPEGTGIGLSIAKAISERLGGTIVLDSELGKGSTFTLGLPIDHENKTTSSCEPKKAVGFEKQNDLEEESSYAIPSVREIKEVLSQRTIVVISRHGPNLLGSGCVEFLRNRLQTGCYFYSSLGEFENPTRPKTVTRVRSAPLETSFTFGGLQRAFDSNGYADNSVLGSKEPIDADFIFLDTSSVYDESLSVNDLQEDDLVSSSHPFSHQVSEEQHHWLRDIRQSCEKVFQIVAGGTNIPISPENEGESCLPQPQHPRTHSSLFLILPPNRAHILNHFCESGVPWYTGWLPFPFIPSRFFHAIFEAKETRKLPSPKNPVTPEVRVSKRSRSQPINYLDDRETLKQNRILLVDDNKVNRRVAQKLILQIIPNVHLDMVVNGKEAVAKISSNCKTSPYDLCLMDLRMPVLDGAGATRQIRSLERKEERKPLPIVALTAGYEASVRDECMQCGMNDILCKPIIREQLAEILNKYLY